MPDADGNDYSLADCNSNADHDTEEKGKTSAGERANAKTAGFF